MPFVRCKFYTESGEPVRGGCRRKGMGCAFVHPGDPDWDNAPPPSFKSRDKGGDVGGFKSWGGMRDNAAPLGRDTGGNAGPSTANFGGGWGDVSGWGDGGGWDNASSWDVGGSANQALEPAQPDNSSTTTSRNTSTLANEWNQADTASAASGNTKSSESGWGGADTATSSGWGRAGNDNWGASDWGNTKDSVKGTESGWGTSSGDNKDADKDRGLRLWNGGWGTGWGDNSDTTKSWGALDPMVAGNQAKKETERNKRQGKGVPAPPRIRIPDNENKKHKISGTNNEPLGPNKWRESHSSILVTASTPVTTSTPVATLTPTDSSHHKRKRDAAYDDKFDVFKEYIKSWERGVRARFLLAEAEAKRSRWFRTQKSACYTRIGEAGRKRLDGERAECDKEVGLQTEKLSCAVTSLVKFHDTISSNLDLGQRYNIGEQAENFITESKAFVDRVRALLVEHVLKDRNEVQSSDARKHLSGADVSSTSVDSLRSQVRDLEERFDHAQTELTLRHRRDIRTEINELLSDKIDTLRRARQREIDHVASQPRPEIVIPPSAIKKIDGTAKHVKELDVKMQQAVDNIHLLLHRVDTTTKKVSELEQELSVNKVAYSKRVQEMAAEKQEAERRIDERLEKIREQFEQLVASRSPGVTEQPAMSPTIQNLQDKLMDSLRPAFEALLDRFYEQEVLPTIDTLQRVVIQASDRHQEEAIKVLWGKIQPAMNMVAGVSRWLDSQELGLTAPVEPDHTYTTI